MYIGDAVPLPPPFAARLRELEEDVSTRPTDAARDCERDWGICPKAELARVDAGDPYPYPCPCPDDEVGVDTDVLSPGRAVRGETEGVRGESWGRPGEGTAAATGDDGEVCICSGGAGVDDDVDVVRSVVVDEGVDDCDCCCCCCCCDEVDGADRCCPRGARDDGVLGVLGVEGAEFTGEAGEAADNDEAGTGLRRSEEVEVLGRMVLRDENKVSG
jgi:hypothetical protein